MEPLALVAIQLLNQESRSALPDAPVVEDRPSLLRRLVDGDANKRRARRVPAVASLLRRKDLRRAA